MSAWHTAGNVIQAVLIILGALLVLAGSIGLHRFIDVPARAQGAAPSTLGVVLILVGTTFAVPNAAGAAKLLLAAAFVFLTIPVGIHMGVRAGYLSGTQVSKHAEIDELAEDLGKAGRRTRSHIDDGSAG